MVREDEHGSVHGTEPFVEARAALTGRAFRKSEEALHRIARNDGRPPRPCRSSAGHEIQPSNDESLDHFNS